MDGSVCGGFKTISRNALARLEAEKKPFYYFWQHFFDQNLTDWIQCIASVYGHFVFLFA